MTVAAASVPISPSYVAPTCVRIAITSPDILAQIRQVFAGKNLAVEIVRMPYVEVTVRPAAGAAGLVGAAVTDRSAARRLCAEYRLSVVEVAGRPAAEHPVPHSRPHLAAVPDTDADSPVAVLSQRQHEVMALVSRGVRNADIAARLHVSEKTVKNHINRIFRSLGAGSRVEAVLIWQQHQRSAARACPGDLAGRATPGIPPGRTPESSKYGPVRGRSGRTPSRAPNAAR
ncbi:DNA-binding NarL/FixJ family response regulator [Kitasatospora sp. MAP12-15]|uniref:response regulator transcription factor n=1 Tax=unclassified Kitasatospora TaxID=2633591 RepID=UPI0024753749|nr:helix-turn-helix transcriptional regulator [Kitasatospora sp. MAP12-44]MDH6108244.1 DNA-binding NarL/FixJ family response regulator [Kitasatospora sp. MAP12-44]